MPTLSRYTNIPAVLDTLVHRRITLLDPSTWADRNDREMMAAYAAAVPGRRVFAYCVAVGGETAHHWQVFADAGHGGRINFDQGRLLDAIQTRPDIMYDFVSYVRWRNLAPIPIERLPFIKRQVFRFEREYRLVATVDAPACKMTYEVGIPLSCITSIYFSGELPVALFKTLEGLIRTIPGCQRIPVRHSGLLRNENWARSITSFITE